MTKSHQVTANSLSANEAIATVNRLNERVNAVIRLATLADSEAPSNDAPAVLVKDCMDVRGFPTTHGSALYRGADNADTDAVAVAGAKAAGAVIIGKANLSELCFGATGQNDSFGNCNNPWDPQRITGGSSSGSAAAVACGMVRMALGTDTGGSVRIPAALCGVVGLRPTLGRVSNTGCLEVSTISDTIGPLAASVREAAWLYDAIQGYDPRDPLSIATGPSATATLEDGITGLRIGLAGGFFAENLQPEIAQGIAEVARALESEGTKIADIQPHDNIALREHHAFRFILADVAEARSDLMNDSNLREKISSEVRRRIELGQRVTGTEYAASIRALLALKRWLRGSFEQGHSLLLMPTTPVTAPLWQDSGDMVETTRRVAQLTYDIGAAGIPSISIPMGLDKQGLPMGAMLAAPWGEEALLFRGARVIERALNLNQRPAIHRHNAD